MQVETPDKFRMQGWTKESVEVSDCKAKEGDINADRAADT